jgi:hypothetical protein
MLNGRASFWHAKTTRVNLAGPDDKMTPNMGAKTTAADHNVEYNSQKRDLKAGSDGHTQRILLEIVCLRTGKAEWKDTLWRDSRQAQPLLRDKSQVSLRLITSRPERLCTSAVPRITCLHTTKWCGSASPQSMRSQAERKKNLLFDQELLQTPRLKIKHKRTTLPDQPP